MGKTELCQVMPYGCFGCCGNSFAGKKDIIKGIKKNMLELSHIKDLKKFRGRRPKDDLRECGVCRNLIMRNKRIICPFHPERNKGKDMRKGHCDAGHLCRTAAAFNGWSRQMKDNFVGFIKKRHYDWYSYSIGMDNGKILDEFLENYFQD